MARQSVPVFQELSILPGAAPLTEVRRRLLSRSATDWRHEPEKEDVVRKNLPGNRDVLAFSYRGGDLPHAILSLIAGDEGYRLTNIVPAETSVRQLSRAQYNELLRKFVSTVVEPTKGGDAFVISMTGSEVELESWLGTSAAAELNSFAASANKNTGTAHPSDERQWHAFVIAAHQAGSRLPTSILEDWLVRSGWARFEAEQLAIDYENAMALLKAYDSGRG